MRRSKTLPADSSPRPFLARRTAILAFRCLAVPSFSVAAALSALAVTTVSATATAQDDDKKKDDKDKDKDKDKGKGGGNMDSGDPADTEKSDDGPFKPKGKTGEVEEKHDEKVEIEEVIKAKPRDKLVLFAEGLIGFGKAPPPPAAGDTEGTGDGTSVTLQIGGRFDLNPKMSLGLRVPWTTANIEHRETRVNQSAASFGAPELKFEYRASLSPLTTLPIFIGVGVPIAQGDPDRWGSDNSGDPQAEVNMLADAASGWKDGELFLPKRLPIVIGIGIRHERKALELRASDKLLIAPDLGATLEDPDALDSMGLDLGTLTIPGVALRNVTTLGLSYEFLEKPALFAGVDGSLVFYPIPSVDFESTSTGPSSFQVVFEPKVGARFGKFTPSVSYVLPIGGQLADAGVGGLRLHADLAF
jgi:hypothetical protein